jgi:hypothetical protein
MLYRLAVCGWDLLSARTTQKRCDAKASKCMEPLNCYAVQGNLRCVTTTVRV